MFIRFLHKEDANKFDETRVWLSKLIGNCRNEYIDERGRVHPTTPTSND